jgi:hypothetical protein
MGDWGGVSGELRPKLRRKLCRELCRNLYRVTLWEIADGRWGMGAEKAETFVPNFVETFIM